MAISYPRTLPSTPSAPRSSKFELVFNVDTMESPISKQANHDIKAGHRWEGMFVYPKMSALTAREWKAWFATMYGPAKTFYCYDPDIRDPAGIASTSLDTALVNGASQVGTSVESDGWRSAGFGLLEVGDHVQIGGELKVVTERVTSDFSGEATINFMPPLHVSPGDNTAIIFNNPVGTFRMEEDSVPAESDKLGHHEFAFSFVESF